MLGPGQYLDTQGQAHFSDDDALDEAELDENYIPEGFRKQATMTIPERVKRDPSKYFKFMSDYYAGEAQMMYKQRNQYTAPLRQTLIEHRPFGYDKVFKANNMYDVPSRYQDTANYTSALKAEA